jgi:4-hydroxyphenylacetate 3-monooxygenase
MRRGAEYVSGLRDGRVVFLHGEPVEDVTTHPGFAPAIGTIASLYDGMATGRTSWWTTGRRPTAPSG